jgi:aryl-alcohol dehydrogenase-like predicted oxidoreductase
MYPVPPRPETYPTERIIGNWFKSRGDRDRLDPGQQGRRPRQHHRHIRDGQLKHNRQHIVAALDASLKRLQTDRIDLYQLHWPERSTNFFGQLGYQHKDRRLHRWKKPSKCSTSR